MLVFPTSKIHKSMNYTHLTLRATCAPPTPDSGRPPSPPVRPRSRRPACIPAHAAPPFATPASSPGQHMLPAASHALEGRAGGWRLADPASTTLVYPASLGEANTFIYLRARRGRRFRLLGVCTCRFVGLEPGPSLCLAGFDPAPPQCPRRTTTCSVG